MTAKKRMVNSEPGRPVRIGAAIGPHDPFWVQLRETVYQRIAELGASLVPLEISDSNETLYSLDPDSLAEEILAQEVDVVVCQTLPLGTIFQLVSNGLPVVFLGESPLEHNLFCSPRGLYDTGQKAAEYIAEKIGGHGRVVCVGGLLDLGEDKGVSRISGFSDTLRKFPGISMLHCPTAWRYDQAYPLVTSALRELGAPINAIFGISDSLALAARDAGRALGVISPETVIVGINGDPLALAAIIEGSLSATIETSAEDLGGTAVELAVKAARGEPLPQHYPYKLKLITAENVGEHAARKLLTIASLPSRLVGVNREEERHRLIQMEIGAMINRHVGSLLDHRLLLKEMTSLICANFAFDHVQFFRWSAHDSRLYLESQDGAIDRVGIPVEQAGMLGDVIHQNETIFIPDTRYSSRFSPDPQWPETRSRVVLPLRLGDQILGLLDLHSRRPILNLRWELIGLQSLADQFAIALRNAELYSEALAARTSAERANQLKTRLLANVSHELRTPLNVILGYSQAALSTPDLYGIQLPEGLQRDLGYIYQSGEHLIRIINDLLDLSRAEIGELNVFPEPLDPVPFFQDVFDSMAKTQTGGDLNIHWEFQVPHRLPVIQADPVRLRQVLLNLLSNASKFTNSGRIVLGAQVEPPYLHFWISDSGSGIPVDQQERIFEPFVTSVASLRRPEGIGLGLTITRRLVALHNGSMSLESQPGHGSTFHVYWPLPNLAGEPALPPELGEHPALVLFSAAARLNDGNIPAEIRSIAASQQLEIYPVRSADDLEPLLREVRPVALAWDLAWAAPEDWNIIQRMRRYPQLSSLPLILFQQEEGQESPAVITNVMMKPFQGKRLIDLIESMRPAGIEKQVLIVDDDAQARVLYSRLVNQALPGTPVLLAEDGDQALRFLAEQVPSLVILDLVMPKVDGFSVLQQIRQDPRTSKVPVIVLSGKMLNFEDVARLNFFNVVFYAKGMLLPDEIISMLQGSVSNGSRLSQPTSLLVKHALAYLHQNYAKPITRSDIAEAVGISENYLTHIFHQELGLTPSECVTRLRVKKAAELLQSSADSVTAIANQVGFDDSAYFSRVFRKINGCSPQAYRLGKTPDQM